MSYFIFLASILIFIIIIFSFVYRLYILGILGSMGMIVIGVTTAIYGMNGINNFFTDSLAVVYLGIGFYVLVNGSLQKIKEIN